MMWHPGHWASVRPDHPAIVLGQQRLSYRELDDRSLCIAAAWHARGLRPGDTVAYPREIEVCLEAHPAVAEAAVFGLPDADFGEAVQAIVQLHDRQRAGADMARALASHVRDRLARFKCPKHIDFVDELPCLSGGKVSKSALRDTYRARENRGHAASANAGKD